MTISRRQFLTTASAGMSAGLLSRHIAGARNDERMRLGLVTYNWGRDWDLPTVIRHCEEAEFEGVELRSTHKHGVEITLGAQQRKDVARRFKDSPVEIVGLGSACEYHSNDAAVVEKNINETMEFIKLCHDIGGSGVKVRPNGFVKGVERKKTLEQIGHALNKVAKFGAEHNVQIRLEVHGRGTSELPHIKTIMDVADHPGNVVCWNCNPTDLKGEGLEHNFQLVQERIGTIHIHDLRNDKYPWHSLFRLLKGINFTGWTLLEDGAVPNDILGAMKENTRRWREMVRDSA